jgi:RNA polymerase sigma-70 factor (ECF subfamily)
MTDDRTRSSLLVRVTDPRDDDAWSEFAAWVGHVITRFLRRQGAPAADAQDIVQEVLLHLSGWVRSHAYDRSKGKFRHYLHTVARCRLIDFYRRRRSGELSGADVDRLESRDTAPDFDEAFVDGVLRRAAALARTRFSEPIFQAFWLTYVERMEVTDAAARLNTTISAVNTARSRVRACVEEIIRTDGVF